MQNESFEWDDHKAASNRKHHRGVTFNQACAVFDDCDALEVIDEREVYRDLNGNPEERLNIIGLDGAGLVLAVTYT